MNRTTNPFTKLAEQAERGDVAANVQLRRKLEPEIVHMVRCVIQDGRERTNLDRRILAEARRVGLRADLGSREERERLILKVAHRVCATVVSRLQKQPERLADETVCDSVFSNGPMTA